MSVITVVKNNRMGLQKTYESLLKQTHGNWEMLVVIAASTDGSVEFVSDLQKNDDRVKVIPDTSEGIYAAMNQGLELRTSDLVWFMNSGDEFYKEDTLEITLKKLKELSAELIIGGYATRIGETLREFSKKSKFISAQEFSLNVRGGCHQSMLFKVNSKSCDFRFNQNYRFAADFDYTLKHMQNGNCYRTNLVLSIIEPGGISSREIQKVIREKQAIRREFFLNSPIDIALGQIWSILVLAKITFRTVISKFTGHKGRMGI